MRLKRCSHCARHRTTSDDSTTPDDVVRCRAMYDNFYMQIAVPCGCRTMAYDTDATKFNLCVSVVALSYDIVQYVNTTVKSICSITATPDDIVRHRRPPNEFLHLTRSLTSKFTY